MLLKISVLSVAAVLLAGCAVGGGSSDKARQIEVNDNGVTLGSGEPVIVGEGVAYQNVSVPQDFSLKMPVIAQGTGNTIDLGRCYMDFAPAASNLDAHTRRLCGLQFTQVTLELRALFLDLALPDIRAYCHNRLQGCDLSSQEFTITISESVMRRVQKLFSFYQYTGLESYFQYNGYEIRNGAKIPFRIDRYEEAPCGQYDYRAVIRTRVIGTYAGEAQVRDNAGDVIILWDKQRQNITMDFRTSVELFGFQINLRRTYDYSDRATGVRYTSSVNYWTVANPGFSTLVHGNSMAAESCSNANSTCTKFRHIASEFIGDDGDLNGLGSAEAYYDALRFSEGVVDGNGGIVDTYLSVGGSRNRERVVFRGISSVDFLYQSASGTPLVLTYGDALNAAANTYVQQYATASRLNMQMTANLKSATPVESRSLSWLAATDAKEVTQIAGFAVAGAGEAFVLRWGAGNHHTGRFAYGGSQAYSAVYAVSEAAHPLY